MDIYLIYAIVVGSFFVLFLIRHAHKLIMAVLWSRRIFGFIYCHFYPVLVKRNRVLPAITRLHILLQSLYWAGTIVCNTVGVSSLAEGSTRAGALALVNLVPLLFSDRLSFAADILSMSYRTYLQIHKAIGVMAVLQLTAHIVLESVSGNFVLSRAKDTYGLVAVTALGATAIIALPVFRKYLYEVFLKLHYALSAVVVFALWRRFETSQRERIFLIIAVFIHGSLSLLRVGRLVYRNTLTKRPWSKARITKRDEAFEVTLSVPRPWKFKPGQYIYLCVPRVSLGSFLEWHPFSIAWWSCNDTGEVSFSLLVKPQHGLTYRLMRGSSSSQEFYVAIDGPYGQGIDTSQYGTLILVATDVGIAAQIPLIKQTLADYRASRTSVRKICVIWQMDQEYEQGWVADWMNTMLKEDRDTKMLHSSLYVLHSSGSQAGVRIYGERVKKFYHPADLPQVLTAEIQGDVLTENATTTHPTEMSGFSTPTTTHATEISGFSTATTVHATEMLKFSTATTAHATEMSKFSTAAYDKENKLDTLNIDAVEDESSRLASRRERNNMGRILISVSTNALFRDQIRELGRKFVFDDVDIKELDFQPEEGRRLWNAEQKSTGQGRTLA